MSRVPAKFRESDLRRASKVAKQFGYIVDLLPDGTIRLQPPVDSPKDSIEPTREFHL